MPRKAFLLLLLTMVAVAGATGVTEAKRKMERKRYSRNGVTQILSDVAAEHGLSDRIMMAVARIESGLRPWVQTGTYKGLFQMSNKEFKKHGGKGSIWDPRENANAFANLLKANARAWERETGRPPTEAELYLMHQQGKAGAKAHLSNPDQAAWKSIRKYYPSDRVAKKAIWGNVPSQYRKTFGSVDNITSRQFTQMWADKVGGERREVMTSQLTPPMPERGMIEAEGEAVQRNPQTLPGVAEATARAEARRGASGWSPSLEVPIPPPPPADPRTAIVRRREEGEGGAAPLSPTSTDWIDRAFGKPFGELYQNQVDLPELKIPEEMKLPGDATTQLGKGVLGKALGIPPQPPLFRQLFPELYKTS